MKPKKELLASQLYSVQKNGDQIWQPYGPVAWSTTNVLVFPSSTATHSSFLHFFYPDAPWEVSLTLTPHSALIKNLKFDGKGTLLCVIDAQSRVSIWAMQGHIINDWQIVQITDAVDSSCITVDTQPIICFSWTNIAQNYVRKSWNVKAEDVSANWTAKFTKVGPSTLLKSKILGVSVMSVSARGLLSLLSPGKKARTSFLPITNMQVADILVSRSEDLIHIATVDMLNTLRLYTIEVQVASIKFLLSRLVELTPKSPDSRIMCLKFDNSLTSDSDFFIAVHDQDNNGSIEKWKFAQTAVPVNRVLCSNNLVAELANKLHWEKQLVCKLAVPPVSLDVPFLPYSVTTSLDANKIGRVIIVGCQDSSVQILDRTTLTQIDVISPEQLKGEEDLDNETKSYKNSFKHIKTSTSLTLSPASCCMATLSRGTLSMFSFWNNELETDSETVWLSSVLEHCILNNWAHWEIMSVANRQENMLSRLENTLNRSFDAQNPDIRQLYFSRMMSIKMMLYKLQPQTSHWPGQLWSSLFLNCLADKLKNMLPVEVVNNFVCPTDIELNSLVSLIDPKQFNLPEQQLLAQQTLFQWVLDYAQLISICVLPPKRTSSTNNWQSVVTDSKTLNNLRELLGYIKIWSTIHPRCSPVLCGSDTSDFSAIFKTISMLVKQFPYKNDIPNSDYDKIQLFQQKLTTLPRVTVSALYESSTSGGVPLRYHFQFEPNSIKCAQMLCDRPSLPLAKSNSVINTPDRDMIRNTVLSAHSLHTKQDFVKECVVCGCVTTLHQPDNQRDWWTKWKHACVCGGSWKNPTVLA